MQDFSPENSQNSLGRREKELGHWASEEQAHTTRAINLTPDTYSYGAPLVAYATLA